MNPHKTLLIFVSLFIIFSSIACSIGSFVAPDDNGEPPVERPPRSTNTSDSPGIKSPYISQSSNEITIPAGEDGLVNASCPSGSLLLGGGFVSADGMKIYLSFPDSEGWQVGGWNTSGASLTLTAYAYCLHDSPGNVRVVREEILVSGYPKANCESTELLTGGGYEYNPVSLSVYISTPDGSPSPVRWSVYAKNISSSDQAIQVYAVCLSGSGLTGTLVRDDSVSYLPGTPSTGISITCPEGAVMIAGGYEGENTYMSRLSMENAGMWEIQTLAKFYLDGSLDHAVCLYLP